jgi:hypothetical protein
MQQQLNMGAAMSQGLTNMNAMSGAHARANRGRQMAGAASNVQNNSPLLQGRQVASPNAAANLLAANGGNINLNLLRAASSQGPASSAASKKTHNLGNGNGSGNSG